MDGYIERVHSGMLGFMVHDFTIRADFVSISKHKKQQ